MHSAAESRLVGTRVARHGELNHIIGRAFNLVKIPNRIEPAGLCRSDGKRPDGQTLLPWGRGRLLVWDVTCVHHLAPSYLSVSVNEGPTVADLAETKKAAKYAELADRFLFQPVAVETLGGMGRQSLRFLSSLGARIAAATGEIEATKQLRQRFSLAVQIGNAACVLETFNNCFT